MTVATVASPGTAGSVGSTGSAGPDRPGRQGSGSDQSARPRRPRRPLGRTSPRRGAGRTADTGRSHGTDRARDAGHAREADRARGSDRALAAGRTRRGPGRAAAAGAATLGLVALAGCTRPTPITTVTVGTTSVSTEAAGGCYRDHGNLGRRRAAACLKAAAHRTITVQAGQQVRIGVDPAIAHAGWALVATGPVLDEPSHQTYRSFDGDTLFTRKDNGTGQAVGLVRKVRLAVVELDAGAGVRGLWHVTLRRES